MRLVAVTVARGSVGDIRIFGIQCTQQRLHAAHTGMFYERIRHEAGATPTHQLPQRFR